jgi:hypothetical protein
MADIVTLDRPRDARVGLECVHRRGNTKVSIDRPAAELQLPEATAVFNTAKPVPAPIVRSSTKPKALP